MRKRKWLLTLCVIALLLVAAFMLPSWYSRSAWARAYSKIELGMTRPEVAKAIGLPPGYFEGETPVPLSMSRLVKTPPIHQSGVDIDNRERDVLELQAWIGRDYVIWVSFDEHGNAVGTYFLQVYPDRFREPMFIRWFSDLFS